MGDNHPRLEVIREWIAEGRTSREISREFQIPEGQVRDMKSRWRRRQEILDRDPSTNYLDHVYYCNRNRIKPNPEWQPKTPSSPSSDLPGSRERLQVYAERMERGEDLWHDGDDNGPLPVLSWLGDYSTPDNCWRRRRKGIKEEDHGGRH